MAQPLFPQSIDLDDDSVRDLQSLLSDATDDIDSYINSVDPNRLNRAQVINARQQTTVRLQQLGLDLGKWVSTNVPAMYTQGQQDAARQQASFGDKQTAGLILGLIAGGAYAKFASEKAMTTAKIISPSPQAFDLQTQSVQTLMEDMSRSFGNTLTYLSRTADNVISSLQSLGIRKLIAEQAANGAKVADITKQVSGVIRSNGIYAMVDKGGRRWTPENYADMLVKTKLTEARNNGLMNALLLIGQDLVEVSAHGAKDACADWEGRILSISGRSKLYPSVQEATNGGLFHPRCKHTLNAIPPDTYPEQSFTPGETVLTEDGSFATIGS